MMEKSLDYIWLCSVIIWFDDVTRNNTSKGKMSCEKQKRKERNYNTRSDGLLFGFNISIYLFVYLSICGDDKSRWENPCWKKKKLNK